MPGNSWIRRSACVAATAVISSVALTAAAEEPTSGRPAFERLRQDEDWSVLCDPSRRTIWYDAIKCMPLNADRSASLSLGGEVRERYEYTGNPLWGEDPQDQHGVFLQRYVLHGDLRLGPDLRLFGQLYSALEDGRAGPASPVDENRIDLQQAFLEVPLPSNSSLRLGRQELRYGSARLVDVREGPNVRRKFDGARARLDVRDWRVDALAVRPALVKPGAFDDGTDHDQALWGAYGTGSPSWLPFGTSVDLYYLGYENEAGSFDQEAEFKAIGWVSSEHRLAPTINIADLFCIADILDNPLLFLHYMSERIHLQKSFQLLGDELDFLGLYIETGFNIAGLRQENTIFSPSGMSEQIDRYYTSRDAGIALPKPKAKLMPLFAQMITKLNDRRTHGWTTVGMHLLSAADPKEQREIEK